MKQVRSYGPGLVLLLTIVAALFAGPHIMRQIAYAQVEAEVDATAAQLAHSPLGQLSQAFRHVTEHAEPSVVHVSVKRRVEARTQQLPPGFEEFFRRRGLPMPEEGDGGNGDFDDYNAPQTYGNGSGWVYDNNGHIITNWHVVDGADVIEVKFFDKTTREAELIGKDPNTDIAVLKVKTNHLHPAEMAEQAPGQGEIVFAFGSPFRFEFSVSQGIVSGKGRQLGILGQSGYENFLQTDAAINPGNSGGPLTNIYGEVVGMNTAIASRTGGSQGLGFAIPVGMLRKIIPQLIDGGRVARGYVGVEIRDDPRLLKTYGVDAGVVVEGVVDDSPADKAGLKRGDVILEVDGAVMHDAAHLRSTIADKGPNTKVKLLVLRDGKRENIEMTLAELPVGPEMASVGPGGDEAKADEAEVLRKLGLERVAELDEKLADRLGVDEADGVLVERVRGGSVAATEGVGRGTLITHVQGKKVGDVKDLISQLKSHDLTRGVRLTVAEWQRREWRERFVVLQLDRE